MAAEMLPFPWPDRPRGDLTAAVDRMVAALREEHRVTAVHEPMIALLYRLAEALELASVGRGASVALLSAQFMAAATRLEELPVPVEADSGEYDVVLLPIAAEPGDTDLRHPPES